MTMADQGQQQPGGMKPAAKAGMTGLTCAIIAGVVGCGGFAVVGILAAIAIPNFMKFQCKSLQSEAKANLRSLYTAEKSFYAEYGTYTSDLVSLGWTPSGSPHYVYGFYYTLEGGRSGPAGHDPERSDTANQDVLAQGGYNLDKTVTKSGDPLTGEDLPEDAEVTEKSFVAAAVGDIKEDSFGNVDLWTIDQDGNITNDEDDCSF
jgi:Tfp pilus assembly protein PilE